ncbi:DUF2855 family protein [bacterium AH-315-P15]|nr:DUF2855 family protein [bacterium AH-315-P15]
MTDTVSRDFLVKRDALGTTRTTTQPGPSEGDLEPGEVLFKVDVFGFSANNITYAVMGEMMAYWNFFPAEEGWGRVPVWGFADVIASRADGIAPGERFYGYLPMSTHLMVKADRIDEGGFMEASMHRAELPAAYNRYARVSNDPGYRAEREAEHMLLQPLFITSFLIDHFLEANECFGAKRVLLSSASSKTAMALAFLLSKRGGVEVVGLTSKGNMEFVKGLGFYDQVIKYDDLASLDAGEKIVYVDMSGDGELRTALHNHFTDNMAYSCMVGATHYDKLGGARDLPGPEPVLFFAPGYAKESALDWGSAELQAGLAEVWTAFVDSARDWMDVTPAKGEAQVKHAYLNMLEGKADPRVGYVLSLFD